MGKPKKAGKKHAKKASKKPKKVGENSEAKAQKPEVNSQKPTRKERKPPPDQYAIPPYKQWAKEAHAHPDKKLIPPKARKTQKKPTTASDIDKYGKGARGDTKARKIGAKEVKYKLEINSKTKKTIGNEKKSEDTKKKKAEGDIAVKK